MFANNVLFVTAFGLPTKSQCSASQLGLLENSIEKIGFLDARLFFVHSKFIINISINLRSTGPGTSLSRNDHKIHTQTRAVAFPSAGADDRRVRTAS